MSNVRPLARNQLPVPTAANYNLKQEEADREWTHFKYAAIGVPFLYFAMTQFAKGYFPYGDIARASLNTSWPKYFMFKGPIAICAFAIVYVQKIQPFYERPDLTSDDE